MVSFYFAPSTSANAKRPYYMVRGLLDAGWDVDVISSESLVPDGCSEVIEHPKLGIYRMEDPLTRIENKLPRNGFGKAVFAVVRGMLWPDITVLWALRIFRRVDFSKYDKILISILPASMMLLGWLCKADSRWVFDYQETVSPSSPNSRRSPISRILMPVYTRLQRAVLKKTKYVIFSTRSYIKDYLSFGLVEKNKAVHIPFFYDDTAFSCTQAPADKFIISYFGTFQKQQGGRSPEVFLKAMSLFFVHNPDARKSTEFRFYGRWIAEHDQYVSRFGVQDVVHINPAVSYDCYIKLLSDTNVLLLVACRADNVYVPSKMLDYFGANRPILGFIPLDSETFNILEEVKMTQYISDDNDVDGGVRSLEQLWRAWREGRSPCPFACAEKRSASFQIPKLIRLLNEV
jgi:hypothetical protein